MFSKATLYNVLPVLVTQPVLTSLHLVSMLYLSVKTKKQQAQMDEEILHGTRTWGFNQFCISLVLVLNSGYINGNVKSIFLY